MHVRSSVAHQQLPGPAPELVLKSCPHLTAHAGCPGNSGTGSVCSSCGGSYCGIIVVVRGRETAFSHVSLSPAAAAPAER